MVLEVNLDLPVRNVSDLVELAKKPGSKLSFGTPGAGSLNHLAGEWLAQLTGAKWEMVHYKGMAQSNPDLINGTIQLQFDQIGAALPLLRSGKLRPLAVTYLQRSKLLPDVPTMAELGFPGFEAVTLFGLIAPARTPPATPVRSPWPRTRCSCAPGRSSPCACRSTPMVAASIRGRTASP